MHDVLDGTKDAGGRSMTMRETFERVRSQVQMIRRLGERMKELTGDGVRSLRLDGVGGGHGGMPHGLDVRMERREAMERMMRRESALLREYEREARALMDGMKPTEYAFCMMYYLDARTLEETSLAIGRSIRQCERYRSEIGKK